MTSRSIETIGGRDPLVVTLRVSAIALAGIAALLMMLPIQALPWTFLREQDAPVLFAFALFQFGLAVIRPARPDRAMPARAPIGWIAAATVALVLAGAMLLPGDLSITRDEILSEFDADVFRSGHLVAMVPAGWDAIRMQLNSTFMLPVKGDVAWVTTYLPGNAWLRAVVGLVLPVQATSALLAGLAVVALHGIARRLWPGREGAPLLAVAMLLTSAQFVITAMTPYAMTAHLALNLVWLWLWLRRDGRGDAGAIAVGWLATGLHQLIFHPLFVAPFIVTMWRAGERTRACRYIAGYAAIALFWAAYRPLLFRLAEIEPGVGPEAASYLEGARRLLAEAGPLNIVPMLANLLRFFAWQTPLLLPLLLLSVAAVRRGEGLARPLAAGIGLTTAAMLLLMPLQGHGWGYRYLHGLIGNSVLLALHGWYALAPTRQARAALQLSLAAGGALLIVHAAQAWAFVHPYRLAQRLIETTPVDFVLHDARQMVYTGNFDRNAPDLSNRPLVLEAARLSNRQLAWLCARYRVAVFDVAAADRVGIPRDPTGYSYRKIASAARARRYLASIHCGPRL